MGQYKFSQAPNISIPRSKFNCPMNLVTSFNHGKLIPLDCFEVLPGDEVRLDLSAIIRMSTPIAPIFGNIKGHIYAFFVPMRLVWEHTAEFYGENKTSAGYQSYDYSIPSTFTGYDDNEVAIGSIAHYLGKPAWNAKSGVTYGTASTEVSVLKERGYCLIWNEYFRAQQLQNPILINLGDTGAIGTYTHGNDDNPTGVLKTFDFSTKPFNVCKEFDYFTAATISPQYGAAVTLPLGTSAPVGLVNNYTGALPANSTLTVKSASSSTPAGGQGQVVWSSGSNYGALLADLSQATAASINTIRQAFQVQKWLERSNFGSRFREMLNVHYGVTSPDSRVQVPEYLGGHDFYINVDQVISTADFNASASQKVGQTGAVSVTGVRNQNIIHKAFVEPGYLFVLMSTKHQRSYSQGFMREDTRKDIFDFYFPVFANLGDQAIKNKEIFGYLASPAEQENNFGYQEHWAEYRYRPNRQTGLLDPAVTGSLDYWSIGDVYNSKPTLSNSWIMENRNALTRALVSGAIGPDYIANFYLSYTLLREMPFNSIPGRIDHFGSM